MSSQHGSTDRAQGHVGGPADPASPSEDENWARLSAVSRSPVLDPRGVRLGRVKDLIVRLSSEGASAPVTGLRAWIGGRDAFVPCRLVDSLTASGTRISTPKPTLAPFRRQPRELLLRADLLRRILIDVKTARLVRAREIELRREQGVWRVAGIDPSLGAWFRRRLPRRWRGRSAGDVPFVEWSQLEPFVGHVPSLRVAHRRLGRLHPAELADLVEAAPHAQGEEILTAVESNPALEADVLEELDDEHRTEFLRDRSDVEVAALLAQLSGDDVADLLMQLDQRRRVPVLNLLPSAMRERVRGLLSYNPESAGGIMNPEFVSVGEPAKVADAIGAIGAASIQAADIDAVYVCDRRGRFRGMVRLAELIRAPDTEVLGTLAAIRTPVVAPHADLPEIAGVMTDYDLLSLPVVDAEGRMIGALALDDIAERMLPDEWRRRKGPARE